MSTVDKIHAQSANQGHRLLPTVFTLEKGQPVPAKAAGPGAVYVIEGGHLFYQHYMWFLSIFRRAHSGG